MEFSEQVEDIQIFSGKIYFFEGTPLHSPCLSEEERT